MFFTQEDYRKIEKWLIANSRKDTEFALASQPFKGTETIAFVQDGKNVKVSLKDLVEQIFILGVSDFLNVTDKFNKSNISLTQAIQLIPFRSRKLGQVITFLNEDNVWGIYQFQGERLNQWNIPSLWVQVIGNNITETVPDNEDLTGVKEGNRLVLSFANKKFEPLHFYSSLDIIFAIFILCMGTSNNAETALEISLFTCGLPPPCATTSTPETVGLSVLVT